MADEHEHGHAHDAHDDHGHDDHGHGHGHGAAAGDIIPENSLQDMALTALAMGALLGLMLMMYWFYQPGGSAPAHHSVTPGHQAPNPQDAPSEHGAAPSATSEEQGMAPDAHAGAPQPEATPGAH